MNNTITDYSDPKLLEDITPKPPVRLSSKIEKLSYVIYPAEGINKAIKLLTEYCSNNKVQTYSDIENACKMVMTNYIIVKSGKFDIPAITHRLFDNKFDFIVSQVAQRLSIFPPIVPPKMIEQYAKDKETSANPIEFLICSYLLMPNLDPFYFIENMNNLKTSVNVLWDRISGVKHSSLQSMLFLYSTEGGVGKSVFQNIMLEWARKRGIKATSTRVPHNQFVGDDFNKNAICIFSDITKAECQNWCKLNDLIDGANYVVEQKGIDRYELKAQAFLIGSSNFHPKDENNRRIDHSFIKFGETKLEPISNFDAYKINRNGSVDIDYYLPIVDRWIISCPKNDFDFSKYSLKIESSAADWIKDIGDDYLFVLKGIAAFLNHGNINGVSFRSEKISIETLRNRINASIKTENIDDIDKETVFSRKQISHIIRVLSKRKKISVDTQASGPYQTKYNIKNLIEDAKLILDEHKIINYVDFDSLQYDYKKEERVMLDVIEQIKAEGIFDYTDFCKSVYAVSPF